MLSQTASVTVGIIHLKFGVLHEVIIGKLNTIKITVLKHHIVLPETTG